MKNEKTIPYNFRMPEKLKARLEKRAREEKRSLNKQLIVLLETSLQEPKVKLAV